MTKEKVLAMEVGNKLNSLVHEIVMGLCDHNWVTDNRFKEEYHYRCSKCKQKFDSAGHFLLPQKPNYSTDISAAWQVLQKVILDGDSWDFAYHLCEVIYINEKYATDVIEELLKGLNPKAICKAALLTRLKEANQ